MDDSETQPKRTEAHVTKVLPSAFFIIFTLILILGIYFLFFKKKTDITIRGGDSVITQIRSLNRYETSEFTIEKIIEAGENNSNAFKKVLFGDKILLIANGKVSAGFDLSKLSEENIGIDGQTIKLTLPAPEILVARLDNEKTRVYDRTQGFLTQGDKDLETVARQSAENSIRTAACEGGILQSASEHGRAQLTALLKAFGYQTVILSIPMGKC